MKRKFYLYSFVTLILCLGIGSVSTAYFFSLSRRGIPFFGALGPTLAGAAVAILIGAVALRIFSFMFLSPLAQMKDRVISYFDTVPSAPLPPTGAQEIDEIDQVVYQIARQSYLMAQGLGQEREKLHCIQESAGDGLLIINNDEKIVNINGAAKAFFHREYNAGAYLSNYTDSEELLNGVQEVLETGREITYEIDDDGTVLRLHIAPMDQFNFYREVMERWVLVYIRDVTAVHLSETMRSEFFANVSHELKTPLTSMMGFGELLASGAVESEEKRKEYQQRMLREARSMAMLIDDILNISKLEDKSRPVETGPVDVLGVAKEVETDLTMLAAQKKVSLFFYGDHAILNAQNGHMEQLLKNLLVNAITYNVEGGKVETTVLDRGDSVFLRVADTGIGIPKEHQSRIFERFYRVDKGRSRSLGGTGLGLSIVKHIVLNYHGTIDLRSTEGVGTTVEIVLMK